MKIRLQTLLALFWRAYACQYRYSSYGWILLSAAIEAAGDAPNISYADTYNVAVKIAQAFAEPGSSPARK